MIIITILLSNLVISSTTYLRMNKVSKGHTTVHDIRISSVFTHPLQLFFITNPYFLFLSSQDNSVL